MRFSELSAFVATHPIAVVAELTNAHGSSPREAGAFMIVAADASIGTIGGGALEYMVIARARQALRDGKEPEGLDIPLGPEIGQCCGGRVEGALHGIAPAEAAARVGRLGRDAAAPPHVFMFGPGQVGTR